MPPQGYLQKLRDICTKHGILLIFDEVITGFGRARQRPTASEYFGVTPDLITMAKGDQQRRRSRWAQSRRSRTVHDTIVNARRTRRDRAVPRLHVFGAPGRGRRRHRDASTCIAAKACSSAPRRSRRRSKPPSTAARREAMSRTSATLG